jgi:NAD(P)-dependent dehydrogenase (short-subunit alcohol dehydrogenase family)
VAVITGASSGIGDEMARYLSERGIRTYACARSPIPSSKLVHTATVDIRDPEAAMEWAKTIASQESHVDVLLNNAGVVGERAPFINISFDVWRDVMATNLLGVVAVTKAMLPLLGGQRPSTIVNISSIMGRFARAGWSPYACSKHALEGLTQVLAQELFTSNIRVVSLHPARINTSLRKSAYGEEVLFPRENMSALLTAVHWILLHPAMPISGLSLSSDDVSAWSREQ